LSYKVKPISNENNRDSNDYIIEPPKKITSHNKYSRIRYIGLEEALKQTESLCKDLKNIAKAKKEVENYLKSRGILKD